MITIYKVKVDKDNYCGVCTTTRTFSTYRKAKNFLKETVEKYLKKINTNEEEIEDILNNELEYEDEWESENNYNYLRIYLTEEEID